MVPAAELRVFQPIEAFPPHEQAHWERHLVERSLRPLRARYRQGTDQPRPIDPGEVYEYTIDLWATSNLFRRGHRIDWLVYAGATAAMLWTQYFAVLPVAVQQAAFAVVAIRRRERGRFLRSWAASTALVGLVVLPLLPFALAQFEAYTSRSDALVPGQAGAAGLVGRAAERGHPGREQRVEVVERSPQTAGERPHDHRVHGVLCRHERDPVDQVRAAIHGVREGEPEPQHAAHRWDQILARNAWNLGSLRSESRSVSLSSHSRCPKPLATARSRHSSARSFIPPRA